MSAIKKRLALLRYPGGKSRMLERLHEELAPMIETGFTEVFVGGGSVALSIAHRFPDIEIWINDLDPNIYAFWMVVLHGHDDEVEEVLALLRRGATLEIFDANRERLKASDLTMVERAYFAIFFCKTTHNGMFNNSPIGGRNQEGKRWKIDCQYKPDNMEKTIRRIREILSGRTHVTNMSAIDLVDTYRGKRPMYLDPPYYVAGEKCYPTFMRRDEHVHLAALLRGRGRWVLSYDDCEEIRDLYDWARVDTIETRYSMASHGKREDKQWRSKTELLITPPG